MIKEIDSETLKARHLAPQATATEPGNTNPNNDLLLVDIRSPEEVAQGAIPHAVHIPMHLLPLRIAELPRDRDLVLYCRSGARSYHACQYLAHQGLDNAINLRGGIIAWARHGFPVGPLGAG